MALVIPAVSVLGVMAASILRVRERRRLLRYGMTTAQVTAATDRTGRQHPAPIGGFWEVVWHSCCLR